MRELERDDAPVVDQRGAETRAEPEEQHAAALVAAECLHGGVVRVPLTGLPRAAAQSNPTQPVPRFQGSSMTLPRRTGLGMPNGDDVVLPIAGVRRLDAGDHLLRCEAVARVEFAHIGDFLSALT